MAVAVYYVRLVVFIMLQPYGIDNKAKINAKIMSQVYCLLNCILQYFTAHYASVFRWCGVCFKLKINIFLKRNMSI